MKSLYFLCKVFATFQTMRVNGWNFGGRTMIKKDSEEYKELSKEDFSGESTREYVKCVLWRDPKLSEEQQWELDSRLMREAIKKYLASKSDEELEKLDKTNNLRVLCLHEEPRSLGRISEDENEDSYTESSDEYSETDSSDEDTETENVDKAKSSAKESQ